MAQQADSEAISLVIQKLTEIVENQNKKDEAFCSESSRSSQEDEEIAPVHVDGQRSYLEHGADILIAEDNIAVIEEVVGADPSSTSPEKAEEIETNKSGIAQHIGAVKIKEREQVVLNFPVKVGSLNITSTEGLIATLQKLDSALQRESPQKGEKAAGSSYEGQQHPDPQKELFKCAKCDYCSHNKQYLKQHAELTHNSERPFKCPFCNYAGKRSHSLKEHLIVHSNCRPYSCMYCNATFRKKGHLTNHVKLHIGHVSGNVSEQGESAQIKHVTYQCKFCSFVTTSTENLQAHVTRHESPLQYCELCRLQFIDSQSLADHLKTKHHGEDPSSKPAPSKEIILVCSECGFKTQDKALLTEHMMKHIEAADETGTEDKNPLPGDEQHIQNENPSDVKTEEEPEKTPSPPLAVEPPEGSYKCAQCSFTTEVAVKFIEHMLSHKPQNMPGAKTKPNIAESGSSQTKLKEEPLSRPESRNKQKASSSEPPQAFTHDKVGGVYRCVICGYVCELQRTIKSHIWKHSGRHDIDYPMFRNGPISVYDDYPIGVPVLLSEKAPVTQMSSLEAQPSAKSHPQGKDTSQTKTKELTPSHLQAQKPSSRVNREDVPIRNRHKTISQIFAESQQTGISNKEDSFHTIVKQENPKPPLPTGKVQNIIQPSVTEEEVPMNDSPGSPKPASQFKAVASALKRPRATDPKSPGTDSQATKFSKKATPLVVAVTSKPSTVSTQPVPMASTVANRLEGTGVLTRSIAISVDPGVTVTNLSQMPGSVTLQGSEIIKLILKKRLQARPVEGEAAGHDSRAQLEHVYASVDSMPKFAMAVAKAGSPRNVAGASPKQILEADQESCSISSGKETAQGMKTAPTTSNTAAKKRKQGIGESLDELELYRLAKKLRSQTQKTDSSNVVVESVSQAYTLPSLSLLESAGASPRSRSPRGTAYSPRANSPRLVAEDTPTRVLRGRSRSADEMRKSDEEEMQDQSHEQASVTLVSLLKKGPNLNPAYPVAPKGLASVKEDKDAEKPKQGICSSLLAVIEQLRERSRSEGEADETVAVVSDKAAGKVSTRKRSKRGSVEEEEDRDALLQNYANIEQIGDQYRCKLCHYTNPHAVLLKSHMRQHKVKKPFECSLCEFMAKSNEELQDHVLQHCKVRTYQCKLCSISFSYKSQLRAHMRVHADQSPSLCDSCDFQGSFTELKRHMLTHDHIFTCSFCEHTFETEVDCSAHEVDCREKAEAEGASDEPQSEQLAWSSRKHLLQCGLCEFSTHSQKTLLRHSKIHDGFAVQCELCNFIATSMRSLKSHMKRHVNDQKFVRQPLEQYKCNLCGYVCHHLPSLKSHMWRHASDTNYSYQDSNDIINAAIDLDASSQGHAVEKVEEKKKEESKGQGHSHQGGHNDFIRFRCCQCGFESVDRFELNAHMRSHSDIIKKTLEVNRGQIISEALKAKNVSSGDDSSAEEDVEITHPGEVGN